MDYRTLMSAEEEVSFSLRARYLARGFQPYRMSKFEEYDLYARNRDFLVSRQVITFTDTDGKLMALKPDVTLSIAKNYDGESLQKLYYNETVYRPSQSGGFCEILQSGVECMGPLGETQVEDVCALAAECLSDISENFVLSVSDLGILEELFSRFETSEEMQAALCACISTKNAVEASRICKEQGLSETFCTLLIQLISTSAPLDRARDMLLPLFEKAGIARAADALSALCASEELAAFGERIIFDFSVLPNRRFYNGVVFSGYVSGASQEVLSGGRYDKLMCRLNKDAGAIGFAVYLDRLPPKEGKR